MGGGRDVRRGCRGLRAALAAGLAYGAMAASAMAGQPDLGPLERVTVTSAGDARACHAAPCLGSVDLSADGRVVAFQTAAPLADGDTGGADIYVRDAAGTTALASVSSAGLKGDADSTFPMVSGDGRFVAFTSGATNLVPGDANGRLDAFVRDRREGTTDRISVSPSGQDADGDSRAQALTPDGRFVVFSSTATNLVAGGTRDTHLFLRDRVTGATRVIDSSPSGDVHISDDAATVLYTKFTGYKELELRVWRRDTAAIETVRRLPGNVNYSLTRSGDARTVLDGGLTATGQLWVTGPTTERVDVAPSGAGADRWAGYAASISADGRRVAFASEATNLVPGDMNGGWDVFVRDLDLGQTARVSVPEGGGEARGFVGKVSLSADGSTVAFASSAANLVPGDTNGEDDLFRRTVRFQSEAITGPGGKCVDVAGAATADGTRVQLFRCNQTAAQRWTVSSDGTVRALGKCLDVAGAAAANGTRVRLWACNGTAAQRWTVTADALRSAVGGLCLDAVDRSTADGTPLQIWECHGDANQRWQAPAPHGPVTGLDGRCLDVAGGSRADGARVQLFACNGTAAQRWTIAHDGSVRGLGKCLDVTGDGTADGTRVQLWTCTGGPAQQWRADGDGRLRNPRSGRCLDVTDGRPADGTPVQIWSCHDGPNQRWRVP